MSYDGKIIYERCWSIKINSDSNFQRYYFKFDEELNGLTISSPFMITEHTVIPRVGDTISFDSEFILNNVYTTLNDYKEASRNCYEREELPDNWRKLYGTDILSYFFPQKDGELMKDYKNRIYNFILKNYECSKYYSIIDKNTRLSKLKPTSGVYKMSKYIIDILHNISYEVIKVNHEYIDNFEKIFIITNVYLIGRKGREIEWE